MALDNKFDFLKYANMLNEKYADVQSIVQNKLIPNGYIILEDDLVHILAFNPNNNSLFFVPSKSLFDDRFCYFQQPFYDENSGIIEIREGKSEIIYVSRKVPFPVFTKENYLNLTSLITDGWEGRGFENSLKKIAKYPILMDSIGEENRLLVKKSLNQKVLTLK